jgi:hypothetical protein
MPDGSLPNWPAAMREPMAAAYLSVSETYFRERIAPAITAVRPTSRLVLWRRVDLDAWLANQAGGGAASGGNSWADI